MSDETRAREAFERFVRWTIEKEYGPVQPRLPAGEREAFAGYYEKLPAPGQEARIRRYLRGFWRSEAGWTARWIVARARAIGARPRVMDAGSGFGTYSMLYAAARFAAEGAPTLLRYELQSLGTYLRQGRWDRVVKLLGSVRARHLPLLWQAVVRRGGRG